MWRRQVVEGAAALRREAVAGVAVRPRWAGVVAGQPRRVVGWRRVVVGVVVGRRHVVEGAVARWHPVGAGVRHGLVGAGVRQSRVGAGWGGRGGVGDRRGSVGRRVWVGW